jgi:hypothetical protein
VILPGTMERGVCLVGNGVSSTCTISLVTRPFEREGEEKGPGTY